MGRREETRVTLEQYLHFYEDPWTFPLSRAHLNQIIHMHGFFKLYHHPKSSLLEYLESIELMPPARSTLKESISSCAFLIADQVAADLEALGWQECPVRSVQTLRSEAEQAYLAASAELPFVAAAPTSVPGPRRRGRPRSRAPSAAAFVITGRRPRSKRKRVSINALTAAAPALPSPQTTLPPLPASPPPPTPPPPSSPPPCTPPSPPPPTPPPPSSPPLPYSCCF